MQVLSFIFKFYLTLYYGIPDTPVP